MTSPLRADPTRPEGRPAGELNGDNQAPTGSQRALLDALTRVVKETAEDKVPSDSHRKPGWREFLLVSLFAIDIAALLLLVFAPIESPLVGMVEKVIPLLFGTSLLTWFDDLRARLPGLARSGEAWGLAVLGFISVALVIFPFNIRVPGESETWVSLDGGRARRLTEGRYLSLGRWGNHEIAVKQDLGTSQNERTTVYHLGPGVLLKSLGRLATFATDSVGILVPVTVEHKGSKALALILRGKLPLLFVGEADYQDQKTRDLFGGETEVEFTLAPKMPSDYVELPQGGPWQLRARLGTDHGTCEVPLDSITIGRDSTQVPKIIVPAKCG